MFNAAFKPLISSNYDNYRIYFNNFSYFDVRFIFTFLNDIRHKLEPVIRDDKYLDIKVQIHNSNNNSNINSKDNIITLYFRDSLHMLNASQAKYM